MECAKALTEYLPNELGHSSRELEDWVRASGSHGHLRDMVRLAESDPRVVVLPEDLDSNPWLLAVQNGTVDLRTGELRDPEPADLITKLAPVNYEPGLDPATACPLWLRFLDTVFNSDQELIKYVQRAVGYSLTGSTREEVFFLLWGSGANGKTTFLETLHALLGEYGKQSDFTTFLNTGKSPGVRNDIARLRGARFVSAVETDSNTKLAAATLKQITGGDTVVARFLYGEHFEFKPELKLWLAVNHKPDNPDTSEGMWRRLRLIPFTVAIPDSERDKDLKEKLKNELPGILAWAVQGCLTWQQYGLHEPDSIQAATNEYRAEQDTLSQFLESCCEVEHSNTYRGVQSTDLYERYKAWCSRNGEFALSQKALAPLLKERGFTTKRIRGYVYWYGLQLKPRDSDD